MEEQWKPLFAEEQDERRQGLHRLLVQWLIGDLATICLSYVPMFEEGDTVCFLAKRGMGKTSVLRELLRTWRPPGITFFDEAEERQTAVQVSVPATNVSPREDELTKLRRLELQAKKSKRRVRKERSLAPRKR